MNKYLKTFLLNALFIILLAITFSTILSTLTTSAQIAMMAGNINNIEPENLEKVANDFYSLAIKAIILIPLFLIFNSIAWVITRMLQRDSKYLWKSILLKISWQLIWTPVLVLFLIPMFIADPEQITIYKVLMWANFILWCVMSYFGLFLYESFTRHGKIYKAMTESFYYGIKALSVNMMWIILAIMVSFTAINFASLVLIPQGNLGIYFSAFLAILTYSIFQVVMMDKAKEIVK